MSTRWYLNTRSPCAPADLKAELTSVADQEVACNPEWAVHATVMKQAIEDASALAVTLGGARYHASISATNIEGELEAGQAGSNFTLSLQHIG